MGITRKKRRRSTEEKHVMASYLSEINGFVERGNLLHRRCSFIYRSVLLIHNLSGKRK